MAIHKYKVINPVKIPKLPFYDDKKGIFYIPLKTKYRYYVEAVIEDGQGGVNYYILLSKEKFDINCRLCHTDDYGRVQIKLRGEVLDYVIKESIERGNVNVVYIESVEGYDVYSIE